MSSPGAVHDNTTVPSWCDVFMTLRSVILTGARSSRLSIAGSNGINDLVRLGWLTTNAPPDVTRLTGEDRGYKKTDLRTMGPEEYKTPYNTKVAKAHGAFYNILPCKFDVLYTLW